MATRPFETIAVVGAGTMGAQIALQCAVYCYPVWLWSRSEATLQRAAQSPTQELDHRLAQQGGESTLVSSKRPDKNRDGEPLRQRGMGRDPVGED